MITNLRAKCALAERLNKLADKAGVKVDSIKLDNRYTLGGAFWPDVHLKISDKESRSNEANERAAALILDNTAAVTIVRSEGLIYLRGESDGLTYQFYAGSGVCERVQVGERVIPAQPERVEPIFEVRCPDPLRDLEAVWS